MSKRVSFTALAALLSSLIFIAAGSSPMQGRALSILSSTASPTPSAGTLQTITLGNLSLLEAHIVTDFGEIRDLAWSPHGSLLALASEPGTWLLQFEEGAAVSTDLIPSSSRIEAVSFSFDGSLLAVGDRSGTWQVLDVEHRIIIHSDRLKADPPFGSGYPVSINRIAFHPHQHQFAIGDAMGDVQLFDAQTGRELGRLKMNLYPYRPIYGLSFSPSGNLLAYGGDNRLLQVWDFERDQEVAQLPAHEETIMATAFSPDGVTIVSGAYDGELRVWQPDPTTVFREIGAVQQPHTSIFGLAYNPDGSMIATIGIGTAVLIWDVTTVPPRLAWSNEFWPGRGIAFSPNGRVLAVGGFDGRLALYSVRDNS